MRAGFSARAHVRFGARAALVYAGTAACATALFILLHHIGNQTPFALATERFAVEFKAEPRLWGTRSSFHNWWEYCHAAGAVLAGSKAEGRTPLRDAVTPRRLIVGPGGSMCAELRLAVSGSRWIEPIPDDAATGRVEYRHWLGGKALYAIGLRFFNVHEYHHLIRLGTYAAYLTLALTLLALGWRALLVASPVLLFGIALSGIEHFSDVAKGTPHLWAVLAPALVALLMRWRSLPTFATRLFCFFAGFVSSYLWTFDGGNFVAAVLIGLVTWFGCASSGLVARARRATACTGLYGTGFVLGIVACTAVKGVVARAAWPDLASRMGTLATRMGDPQRRDLAFRNPATWMEVTPLGVPAAEVLIAFSAAAFLCATAFAAFHAWRGNRTPLWNVLWITALGIASLLHFALPNDVEWAASRHVQLPLALCWVSLIAVLLHVRRPLVHALVFLGISAGGVLAQHLREHIATMPILRTLEDPIIKGYFDVHLKDGALIYVRHSCEAADMGGRFYVDIVPAAAGHLPPAHRAAGYVRKDFYFADHRRFSFTPACAAVVALPAYPIAVIRTGNAFDAPDLGGRFYRKTSWVGVADLRRLAQ